MIEHSRKGILLLLFAALLGGALTVVSGQSCFAQLHRDAFNSFFRLKVKLAYREKAQDFDIVVGCNVHQETGQNGTTYEVGLTPTIFGRRMDDGKVLVVRPPEACNGETTANQKVPANLLPVVAIYDNADRLDFGVAYLSEDAYASPLSALTFGGAIIETATHEDFDRFRSTQTNAIKRELYHSALDSDQDLKRLGLPRVARSWAHICEGYERYLLPEDGRTLLRKYWPGSQPKYWQASHAVESALGHVVFNRRTPIHSDSAEDAAHIARALDDRTPDRGLPSRSGDGVLLHTKRERIFAAAYYPAASDYRLDQWPPHESDWRDYLAAQAQVADMHIDFRDGKTKGLAYCYVRVFPDSQLRDELSTKRRVGLVDRDAVLPERAPVGLSIAPIWFFERDEFAFHFFRINLESMRGDV